MNLSSKFYFVYANIIISKYIMYDSIQFPLYSTNNMSCYIQQTSFLRAAYLIRVHQSLAIDGAYPIPNHQLAVCWTILCYHGNQCVPIICVLKQQNLNIP